MSVSFSSSLSLSHTLTHTHTHLDTSSLPGAINQWKQALKYLTSEPGCRASPGIFTHNIATREEAHAHTVACTDEHDLAPFCSFFFFFYVIVNPLIFYSFRQICYYLLCLQNLYRLNVCFFVCLCDWPNSRRLSSVLHIVKRHIFWRQMSNVSVFNRF